MLEKPKQTLDEHVEDWHRNGGGWGVLAMAALIGDLIAARAEPLLCDACGKELQDDVNVEQSLEGLKTAKYLYHKCAAEGCQWLAVKNERAPWYPCTCGGEHNTPDCPFGYPLKP